MSSTLQAIWPQGLGRVRPDALSLIIVLIPFALASWVILRTIYLLWLHPLSKVPGPPLLAVTDIINQWRSNVTGTFTREASQLHNEFGPLVRIGPNRISVDGSVGYPQVYGLKARGVDGGYFDKVAGYLFLGDEHTLLAAPHELHRSMRRALGHAFSEQAVREQEGIVQKQVEMLMDQLTRRAKSGEVVDVVKWMNYLFFDIIGELTFAKSFASVETGTEHPFIQNFYETTLGDAYSRFLTTYPYLAIPFGILLGRKQVNKAIALGAENREMIAEMTRSRLELGEEPASGQRDFTTYMLKKTRQGEQSMSTRNILANSGILIGAGSETTSSAMSFFFYISSLNADRRQILQDEICSTFSDESSMNFTSCSQITYLQACIEETLRMFPPAAETPPRVSPGAEVGGKFIPQGTIIHVYPWATFRSPANFTDPDSFRPERWLPSTHPRYDTRYANDNLACVKPFSYGPRDCIGKNLAYNEMRLLICKVIFRFDYKLVAGQNMWHDSLNALIIWVKTPLKLQFTLRKK
ncbi:hypothetical protein WAI453_012092 [Rhynchosporium graminicola]|uniref:Related to cytochrome P450 monooxigenase n=1 Tax=Rhynchosporium graminicola TaxID=2792576 RepID=A0A1E1KX22_9HELO|nr:related to cytochrome P450 monooxigenase [Rhynchosporium commune]